jgi:homopolymeric O-antigen transport system ATP-binding protein
MTEIAIRAEGLAKEYKLGQRERYKTMRDLIANSVTAPLHALRGERTPVDPALRLWALQDVSFEVAKGEVVGLIGANGAGKSTLLKVLSRIAEPTRGRAVVEGRVGSLLEVGTGFHPELTGRDNVYLNGIILGMRRREIDAKFSQIVEFAGVEKFIDTPVKRYSSGMQVRLAFSVAAHLQPEVMLVDEVLAVGDAQFQRKSLGRMEEVTREGRTILFVSHNMTAVRKLCPRTILLAGGRVVMDGPTDHVLDYYLDSLGDEGEGGTVADDALERCANDYRFQSTPVVAGRRISILDAGGRAKTRFRSDEDVFVTIDYDVLETISNLQVIVQLHTEEGELLLRTELHDTASSDAVYVSHPGSYTARCRLPANLFGERRFYVTAYLIAQDVQHIGYERALHFDVSFMGHNDNLSVHSRSGYFRPRFEWDVESDEPASEEIRARG